MDLLISISFLNRKCVQQMSSYKYSQNLNTFYFLYFNVVFFVSSEIKLIKPPSKRNDRKIKTEEPCNLNKKEKSKSLNMIIVYNLWWNVLKHAWYCFLKWPLSSCIKDLPNKIVQHSGEYTSIRFVYSCECWDYRKQGSDQTKQQSMYCAFINKTCRILTDRLMPKYIRIPLEQRPIENIRDFWRINGFPQV